MKNFDDQKAKKVEKLRELIHDVGVAMLTTLDNENRMVSRPMVVQSVEGENIWFFTERESGKVFSIRSHRDVNLAFSSPKTNQYASVAGTANLVDDRQKVKELWSKAVEAYFQNGPEDPNIVLIKVRVDQAEYWDSPGNKVLQLINVARTAITGDPSKLGDNESVTLH